MAWRGWVGAVVIAAPAVAAGQDGGERVVDFFQGPVVASGRVLGMGGAFVGVGEGAEGHLQNPAAFAVRAAPFVDDWFDWDVTLSTLVVGRDDGIDVEQAGGPASFDRSQYTQLGFNVKFGEHGFGVHGRGQGYDFTVVRDLLRTPVRYDQSFVGLGYGLHLFDGWYVGGLLYGGIAALAVEGAQVAAVTGGGVVLGGLYAPPGESWRLGARWRTPVVGRDFEGDEAERGLSVPDAIAVPWELGVGGSVMLGPRVYNVAPSFGHGEPPARDGARRYLLLAAEVVVTGPAPAGAVGVSAFYGAAARRSGEEASVSLRVGGEAEIVEDLLVLRGGSYYEPNRYREYEGRVHLTGGFDLRLFELVWEWEAGAVIDWAPEYLNWGVGVGFWY
ncbi:MAG: hypothetical protein R3F65_00605 [bacterium]